MSVAVCKYFSFKERLVFFVYEGNFLEKVIPQASEKVLLGILFLRIVWLIVEPVTPIRLPTSNIFRPEL
ncbi:hypothetical protein COT08_01090 [Candidatus Woesebacteria bacterium CG07_land_8_20_14_0_80_44_9]|uniref:Uncharacterized protein n=1 Tax=Candidatus Woesebacteria bacterium CG07_land_8_20_14_0_80_44_9 TaxID=1975058 RepID=A0A2M6YEF5_9BACT|nr:MAG: hypothetical protein COT08_01090 [Candidatus Woesebacteria bacterium CG07_land_8_20_14_0_80_44_9]